MMPTTVLSKLVWLLDKIQRTQSVYVLEAMGTPRDEAIARAGKGHVGYSLISERA